MRPLRLVLSLATSLAALTFLLYIAFGSQAQQTESQSSTVPTKGRKLKALFSFTSPASLFPPSAIISLTDDNSTFFLARPAAFGPLLPSNGLSGPLWIGSGFGEATLGRGELGCSDVPGWDDGDSSFGSAGVMVGAGEKLKGAGSKTTPKKSTTRSEEAENGGVAESLDLVGENDGTDDHLHHAISPTGLPRPKTKSSDHADIESLQESAEIAGKVVLLKRGGCGFLEKVKWAQNRGGVAVIVGDDVRGGALIRMYAHGDTSNISIPALFTSHTTAHLLSSLLPSGGVLQDLSPEDAAKLERIKSGKSSKASKNKTKSEKKQDSEDRPTSTQRSSAQPHQPFSKPQEINGSTKSSWVGSLLHSLFGRPKHTAHKEANQRPPGSGDLEQEVKDNSDGFVIGEQDWRDPDLMLQPTTARPTTQFTGIPDVKMSIEESTVPNSGKYNTGGRHGGKEEETESNTNEKDWFSGWFGDAGDAPNADSESAPESSDPSSNTAFSSKNGGKEDDVPDEPEHHDGLWVTLTPTNMSSSPFFDTLLVLVVSPLVTLTVVYALLLLRSRIRRRRWRAPKSVVERLPVRTYHTISDSSATPTATPNTSSPTTPLLQHTHSRPASSHSRPRSRTTTDVPATSSSFQQTGRTPEEEKREAGLAEWRRRYGGRQKECVVCLEEYVDGVSRVMSLPCGHEFHEDCITPWLVTRRRTCPICKGDVVRSLSQSYRDRSDRSPSPTRSPRLLGDDTDPLQAQAIETRNESRVASRPIPTSTAEAAADYADELYDDVEANWDDAERQRRDGPQDETHDLSSSLRELGSSVTTTIWRGFDAIRSATGLRSRPSHEEVDRDR